jgi:hypothetical protein
MATRKAGKTRSEDAAFMSIERSMAFVNRIENRTAVA